MVQVLCILFCAALVSVSAINVQRSISIFDCINSRFVSEQYRPFVQYISYIYY